MKYFLTILISVILSVTISYYFFNVSYNKKSNLELNSINEKVNNIEEWLSEDFSYYLSNYFEESINNIYGEKRVFLKAGEKDFFKLRGEFPLLVSLEDIKKYATGYKVILNVGNPYLARLSDVKFKIYWGEDYDKFYERIKIENKEISNSKIEKLYKKQEKSKKFIVFDLIPGAWNKAEVIIIPASEKHLESLSLELLESPKISLMSN